MYEICLSPGLVYANQYYFPISTIQIEAGVEDMLSCHGTAQWVLQ